MAAYCESITLLGFARWHRGHSEEERKHAMRLFDFMNDQEGRVMLQTIPQPTVEFESAKETIRMTLEHEKQVTGSIRKLYELAIKEQDYATQVHLEWFITEQVEEERRATHALDHLNMFGDEGAALLLQDRELGDS